VVGRSGNIVTLQIRWEARVGSTVQVFMSGNPSVFEEVHERVLQTGEPVFYTSPVNGNGVSYALAAHQNFSGIVSDSAPARPGEIVHLYFTGLGAVAPPVATGAVTPVGTLYQLQTPLTCGFSQGSTFFPADILFAGLAPETIGVEQVDMRVPNQVSAPIGHLDCVSQQPTGTFSGFAELPVAPT
jgi:uncharacterized protein (TIGR03437 family)